MRKVDKPEGLVRYDSLSRMMNQDQPLFRSRVLIYGILLIGLTIGFVWSITARPLVESPSSAIWENPTASFPMDGSATISRSGL